MFRSSPLLLTVMLALGLVQAGRTQEPAKAAAPPPEPPAPVASAAVRPLLDAAAKLLSEKKPVEALAAAEKALTEAVRAQDPPGQALARQVLAGVLEASGKKPEALGAWREVEAAWRELGYAPGQIEALARQALLVPKEEGQPAVRRAAELVRSETERPAAAAAAARGAGSRLYSADHDHSAQLVWEAELAVLEPRVPGSLELAVTLHNLGNALRYQNDLPGARRYYERALAIRNREAPDSLLLATTLYHLGDVIRDLGDLSAARAQHERALAIRVKQSPGSVAVGNSLARLGNIAWDQMDLAGGRAYHERALAVREKLEPDSLDVALTLGNLAGVVWDQGDLAAARGFYERALAIRQAKVPGSLDLAVTLSNLAGVVADQEDLAAAKALHEKAIAIRRRAAPGSLLLSNSLRNLGTVLKDLGDLAAARTCVEQALAIRQEKAPGSLEAAASLNDVGVILAEQGDLAGAKTYYERALAIYQHKAPGSADLAMTVNNLGTIAVAQGDLAGAQAHFERSLAIYERESPGSLDVATALHNLAGIAKLQGSLAQARALYERVLAIRTEKRPGTLDVASTLHNLGGIAGEQGDRAASRAYDERALAIRQEKAPGSLSVAESLESLGVTAGREGDYARARAYFERALAIRREKAPGSLDVALSLRNLGGVAKRLGDLEAAKEHYGQAVRIQEEKAPGSLSLAGTLTNLAEVARLQGELTAAKNYHDQDLAIVRGKAPGSLELALSLKSAGILARQQKDLRVAARQWTEAWRIVQAQAGAVHGDEANQAYGRAYREIGAKLLAAQVAGGQAGAALRTSEESSAYVLRRLLDERAALSRLTAPDQWRAYREATEAQNRRGQALARAAEREDRARRGRPAAAAGNTAPPADLEAAVAARERAQTEYTAARLRAEGLYARLCAGLPGLTAPPAGVEAARRALPAGTLYLAFSVGEDECSLLAVTGGKGRVEAYRLPVSPEELRRRVRRLRLDATLAASSEAGLRKNSRALCAALFPAAVRTALLRASRIVIAPDDALWEVPFGALVLHPEKRDGPPRYLGLEKRLVLTPSLLLYHRSLHARDEARPGPLRALVVGNPLTDPGLRRASGVGTTPGSPPGKPAAAAQVALAPVIRGASGEVRTLTEDGTYPPDLPQAAAEAKGVAALYGTRAALGAEPTEAWVRRRVGEADVVHLATHGRFNPYRAMSSGVWLAAPEKLDEAKTDDDEALQAWEIASQLKLRAELVVLSACETGRGASIPGEGLIGLTRALQLAGARSVVTSSWEVADDSTRALMVAFHQEVRKGAAKDEALRRAVTAVAGDKKHPEWRHPYFWSAFMLLGDPENRRLGERKPAVRPRLRRTRRPDARRLSPPRHGARARRGRLAAA